MLKTETDRPSDINGAVAKVCKCVCVVSVPVPVPVSPSVSGCVVSASDPGSVSVYVSLRVMRLRGVVCDGRRRRI